MERSAPPHAGSLGKLTRWIRLQPIWLLVPVVVIVALLIVVADRPTGHGVLLSGQRFRNNELAAIEASFARTGLSDYQFRDGGVWVPEQAKGAYMRALEEAGVLPQALSAPIQEALASSNFFESPAQREARLKFAGEQELASYLRALDGIDDATVRLNEIHQDGLVPTRSIRAMVVVIPTRGQVLALDRLQMICELVAASRVGMSPADVTIFDLRSGQTYTAGAPSTPGQRREQLTHHKLAYEAHWNAKVTELLSTTIPRVSVATEVRLNDETLCPDQIRIVVTVPESYYRAVWRDRVASAGDSVRMPGPAELDLVHHQVNQRLSKIVGQLSPVDQPIRPSLSVAIESVPDVNLAESHDDSHWNSSSSLLVGIIILFIVGCTMALAGFLRDLIVQTLQRSHRQIAQPEPGGVVGSPIAGSAAPPVTTRIDRATAERDELSRLVRTNPAAAAATLRSWVDPASTSP